MKGTKDTKKNFVNLRVLRGRKNENENFYYNALLNLRARRSEFSMRRASYTCGKVIPPDSGLQTSDSWFMADAKRTQALESNQPVLLAGLVAPLPDVRFECGGPMKNECTVLLHKNGVTMRLHVLLSALSPLPEIPANG